MALEFVEQRSGERVADDQQEVQLFALDQSPDVGRVETLGDRLNVDRAAEVPRAERHPVPGTVHERWREQRLQPAVGRGHDLIDGRRPRSAEALDVGIAVAPQHTLRHPGRAAGVEDVQIVGAPLDRRLVG